MIKTRVAYVGGTQWIMHVTDEFGARVRSASPRTTMGIVLAVTGSVLGLKETCRSAR
jgi:hypothetical protein